MNQEKLAAIIFNFMQAYDPAEFADEENNGGKTYASHFAVALSKQLANEQCITGTQPIIIANGRSNEEILQWMEEKIQAVKSLPNALADKESYQQALFKTEDRIKKLTSSAALEVLDIAQDPILPR